MTTLSSPLLGVLLALAGLVVGTVIVYVTPRLVAYRLDQPPPNPPPLALLPIAGAWHTRRPLVETLLVEIASALIFEGLAVHYGADRKLLLACVYSALLIAIAYVDILHRLVLNRLSYPGVAIALAGSAAWPGIGIVSGVEGAAVALVIFIVLQIVGRGALGTGDTKLAALIGAMRGLPSVFNALLLGVLLGGLGAAFALFVLRRGRKEYIAYAPYLAAGAILAFFVTTP